MNEGHLQRDRTINIAWTKQHGITELSGVEMTLRPNLQPDPPIPPLNHVP